MDVDDSDSEQSDGIPCPPSDELPVTANEIVEDLTGEGDVCLDDEESLSSVGLGGGPPVLKPWSYQTEMLQESLRRNVIVAVSFVCHVVSTVWSLIAVVDGYWVGENTCVSYQFQSTLDSYAST